jgi:hypothetical protein
MGAGIPDAVKADREEMKTVSLLLKVVLASTLIVGVNAVQGPSRLAPRVALKRVPEGGIQPQTATSNDGSLHLVYFKGDALGGDLFYEHSADGKDFSKPIRVNSLPGSAIAVGNIRGARMATGRRGSVYVTWNGSQNATRTNGGRTPMLYTRLNQARTAFEPERNLIRSAYGIDGGGGIATDSIGRVFVFWHAPIPGTEGEKARRVWIARSQDDGQTFEPERIAWNAPTGVCGCCSLNAETDGSGRLFVLFRSANETVHRDVFALKSDDHGNSFTGSSISPWTVAYCVMSTEAFAARSNGVLAAWETENRVHWGRIAENGKQVSDFVVAGGSNQKYPSIAESRNNLTLLAWTEGMGWKRGGSVHWQLFDSSGRATELSGSADGVPVWGTVAAYARPDGNFDIFY